jgi:tetratricopeptide (TPR) repeat protein
VLDALTDAYEEVQSQPVSRVVVLASQPGWGKTRLVQELYARLAARQTQPAYWPPAIVDADQSATLSALSRARKAIYPTLVDVPEGARIDWMWWGILCHQRGDGHLAQAMFDDAAQLYAHAPALMQEPIGGFGGRAFDIGAAAIGVLGLLGLAVAPPVGAAITVAGATREGWKNADVVKRLAAWWSSHRGPDPGRVVAADSPEHHEDRLARLVEGLARLARARPLIVVVDDAQFADDTLLRMLDGLLRETGVLVIATAWPSHLDASEGALPFAQWARSFAAERPERFARFDLEELAPEEIDAVVHAELPAAAGVAARLYELYGTNLLAIHGVLRLPRVRRLAERGSLDPEAVAELPRDVEAMFGEHWAGLPDAVQHVLALAAQPQGTRYLPDLVAAALAPPDVARERLDEGVSPYAWAREVDASLHSFVEPVLHQIAKARADELLLEDEIEAWRAAIIDTVQRFETLELSALAAYELFEQHVALVLAGEAPEDIYATRSAYALAEAHASRYDYARAVELARRARGWSGRPDDDPETLIVRGNIVGWLGESGRASEALRELDGLLPDQVRVHGADAQVTLYMRALRGHMLRDAGRVSEGLAVFDALLTDALRLYGPDAEDTLAARFNLATAIHSVGDSEESARRFAELLGDLERVLGPDHRYTLSARSRLAFATGDPDEAVRQLERVLADRLRLGGPDDPQTITAREDLAMWLQSAGRTDEALAAFEAVLADRLRLLGPGHPDTLNSRNSIGDALGALGHVEEAMRRREELVADWLRLFGPDHPGTLAAREFLAEAMFDADREEEGFRELECLLADRVRVLGPDHPETLDNRNYVARYLDATDRQAEAARQFELLAEGQARVLGPDHRDTFTSRHNHAAALMEAEQYEDGGRAFLALVRDMERALGPDDPDTIETRDWILAWIEAVEEAAE